MLCHFLLKMWSVAVLGVQCGPMPDIARLDLDDGEIRQCLRERECALIESLFVKISAFIRPMQKKCHDFNNFKHAIDSELKYLSFVNCIAEEETSRAFFDKIKRSLYERYTEFALERENMGKQLRINCDIKEALEKLSRSRSYDKQQGNAPLSLIDPNDIFALLEDIIERASGFDFPASGSQSPIAQMIVFLSASFARIDNFYGLFSSSYIPAFDRCLTDYRSLIYHHLMHNLQFADKEQLKSVAQRALDIKAKHDKLCENSEQLLYSFNELEKKLDSVRDQFARKLNAQN
ncbi:hypothetical protein PAPHI01_0127 [Pancytospora philotis]|nr:hypothetical protein PAPHI01_0127 [Pancytospora philotis]